MNSVRKGFNAETTAEDYLKNIGYKIIKRNFHFGRYGEIDIIAYDNDTLVFIEVKYATNDKFGDPINWITQKKRKFLKRAAEGYLYINNLKDIQCRFDAILIEEKRGGSSLQHIKNAF